MDIEYGRSMHSKGSIENVDDPYVKGANPISDFIEERKNQIDIRLRLIQLEETAPNEAKVIDKNKEKTVLDMEHYKALLEEEKIQKELEAAPKTETVEKPAPKEVKPAFSKVLIGRYQSFEEAKEAQAELKAENGTTTFIRKMGDIYSLQIGSYTNENLAQEVADKYSGKYSVWILQD